jgi:ribosomal protein L11 methyltransferase
VTRSADGPSRTASTGGAAVEAPATGPGTWLELAVVTDSEAVEAVSEIRGRVAPGGTSVEPGFELIDEGLGARPDPARPVTVRAYLPARAPAATTRAVAEVDAALDHLRAFNLRPIGPLETRLVNEADWAEAWKRHFPVLRVGHRIVIRPTWRRHRRQVGDVVLALDPGMAFGTGLHPTTRLCLEALEDLAGRSWGAPADAARSAGAGVAPRILDVGCGSGILAIAALRLGAAAALGVDTDPIAVESTEANARRNGVRRRIRTRLGSLPSASPPHDVVVANLIATLLVRLAADLAAELRPGGTLIASGIFIDREPEVRIAFEAAGLRIRRRLVEGDWVALEALRDPEAVPGPDR